MKTRADAEALPKFFPAASAGSSEKDEPLDNAGMAKRKRPRGCVVPRLPNVPEEHGKRRQPQDGLEREGLPKVQPLCNFQGGSSQGSNHTMAPREVAHWTPTGWIHT